MKNFTVFFYGYNNNISVSFETLELAIEYAKRHAEKGMSVQVYNKQTGEEFFKS